MSYADTRTQSHGAATIAVGSQKTWDSFGFRQGMMLRNLYVVVNATLANANVADKTITAKEILSKIKLQLALNAPVNAQTINVDGRGLIAFRRYMTGERDNEAMEDVTITASGSKGYEAILEVPFFAPTFKRSKDWHIPASLVRSLTVGVSGNPDSVASGDITWTAFSATPLTSGYIGSSVSYGPIFKLSQIPQSEDAKELAGKVFAVASMPPVGKDEDDYPACDLSIDGDLVSTILDGEAGYLTVQGSRYCTADRPSPTSQLWGTNDDDAGEGIDRALILPPFSASLLDVTHKTIGIKWASSISTALGTSDELLVAELLDYAKPDGSVKVAEMGKGLHGALENLPVEAA